MERAMTAFFGIEEHNAQGFLDKNIVCLPRSPEDKPDLHSIVSAIKSEDTNDKDAFIAAAKTRLWAREKCVRTLA
jgi:hypothetical protein